MTVHQNFIAGNWIPAGTAAPNINPSNTKDVVGDYARASRAQAEDAIKAAKAASAAYARSTPQERYDALKKISDEILARKDELGRLLSREEGKTLPEGIGEATRAGQIFAFFAGEALRIAGEKVGERPAGRRRRDHARAGRRGGADHAVELPHRDSGLEDRSGARLRQLRGVQAGRSRAGLRVGACPTSSRAPASRRACSIW